MLGCPRLWPVPVEPAPCLWEVSCCPCLDTTRLTTLHDTILNPAPCSSTSESPARSNSYSSGRLTTSFLPSLPHKSLPRLLCTRLGHPLSHSWICTHLGHIHGHSALLWSVWFSWYKVYVQHNTFVLDLEECDHCSLFS